MNLVRCTVETHAQSILEIFNEVIANSTALYEYEPRALETVIAWFEVKERGRFPVLGLEDSGRLLGFGSYGVFRDRPAYKYSVEHSVYVHAAHRGSGVGSRLLSGLIECARQQDYHVMVGGIDASNEASVRLHEKLGFRHAGTIRQTAFKFGRWLDLAFYQLTLDTPAQPDES